MKLKFIIAAVLSTITVLQCCDVQNTITIRPATLDDLDATNNFTHKLYHEHFKPIFALLPCPENNLEDFINKKIATQQNANKEYITKQLNQKNYRLLIAENTTSNTTHIIGYCRFFEKNPHNVHINLLGIDKSFREKKIGTKLLFTAINTFNDITYCTLRTLAHNNDDAHAFYKKNGFTMKELISLDLLTGVQSTDPTAPTTHAEYRLEIKQQT